MSCDDILNLTIIQKRVDSLHQSQVAAYREAATKAIKEWAMAFPLEPMEDGDSEQAFVDRCTSALTFVPSREGAAQHTWPNWKLENSKALASLEVRKRARAIYEKYHPARDEGKAEGQDKENDEDGSTDDGEGTEETGDENEEDDEMDGEEGGEEDGAVHETNNKSPDINPKPRQSKNSSNNNKAKRKTGNNKNNIARKKGSSTKGFRKGQSARGGRRGGRGGVQSKKTSA
ncbi:hypothetical protein IV203_025971 [Nitzschia inconspicua]|uniref:Uncharacterized protein n=1 Tax=Nitzschia inconspicua TaxID=303405 RepID=A0A9K3PWM6_9STRA|nr:hypothetical protein IV203_025971 [Nitzschia inconspicua]